MFCISKPCLQVHIMKTSSSGVPVFLGSELDVMQMIVDVHPPKEQSSNSGHCITDESLNSNPR